MNTRQMHKNLDICKANKFLSGFSQNQQVFAYFKRVIDFESKMLCRYQHNQGVVDLKVKKVFFFWICRDTNAFEWFTDSQALGNSSK